MITFFTDDDFYNSLIGKHLRGDGRHKLYNSRIAIHLKSDGTHEVLKDHFNYSSSEIERIVRIEKIDKRLLLL